MKVLHIIDNLSLGGAQFMVKGFVEFQQDKENHYVYSLRKDKLLIEINHSNVILSSSNSRYSLFPILELRNIIIGKKIDLIHCYLQKSQIVGWLVKRFFHPQIKLIFHELGAIAINKSFLYSQFMKKSSPLVNIYLAASEGTKKMLVDKIGISPKRIITLYNFIVMNDFNKKNVSIDLTKEKQKLGIDSNTVVIGFAGRLSKEKGCEYLIKAIPYVKSKIKVLVAGIGQEHDNLKAIIKNKKIEGQAIFLGFVKNMVNVYGMFDILVIPSEHESFGLIAIECQSMGVPVIASDIPGLNEVVIHKKNGLLFECKNYKDLANKIDYLIEDKKLTEQLIKNGIKNAKQYDIVDYNKNLHVIYQQLLDTEF